MGDVGWVQNWATMEAPSMWKSDTQAPPEIRRMKLEAERGRIEDAKKAEFKNQRKKALDKYYEALYFLKNDEIDDSLQQDHISMIESKIKELSS